MKHILTLLCLASCPAFAADAARKPNIIVILADDLGYGDLGCYGATKVKTPNIDRLAREGMRFTDAHSPASVCSPSRYNLMTGRYCWRSMPSENRRAQLDQWARAKAMPVDGRYVGHVAFQASEPLIISPKRMTVASLLKTAGYTTACIGKWHLGLGQVSMPGWDNILGPDWNSELKPGPLEVGFDYYFGLPVANSEQPKVFVENHRVARLDPAGPIRLRAYYSASGRLNHNIEGGKAAQFQQDHIDDCNTEKAVTWIEQTAAKQQPLFLYLAYSSPHGPLRPGPRYKGTSEIGAYGDAVQELDGCVGEVLAALDRLKLADDTLVIFTSDNGGVADSGRRIERAEIQGHNVNGPLRGQKTEVYEGGHRVPFIARWPGRVQAGSESGHLLALTDLLATFAELAGRELPADAGEDSFSFLSALLTKNMDRLGRTSLVNDSVRGVFSIREGPWKLIIGHGGGGYYPNELDACAAKPGEPPGQLFNLDDDPAETKNLYTEKPEIVPRLTALLEKIKTEGRSRP